MRSLQAPAEEDDSDFCRQGPIISNCASRLNKRGRDRHTTVYMAANPALSPTSPLVIKTFRSVIKVQYFPPIGP